jgi:hypothetical protein
LVGVQHAPPDVTHGGFLYNCIWFPILFFAPKK